MSPIALRHLNEGELGEIVSVVTDSGHEGVMERALLSHLSPFDLPARWGWAP